MSDSNHAIKGGSSLRKEIAAAPIGQSKPLRSKHIDTLNVLSGYVDQNRALEEENRSLRQEYLDLQKKANGISGLPKSYVDNIERENEQLKKEKDKAINDLDSAMIKIQHLNEQKAQLQEQISKQNMDVRSRGKAQDDAARNLDTMQGVVDSLQQRVSSLEAELKEQRSVSQGLQQQCTEGGQRVLDLQAHVQTLEEKLADADRLLAASQQKKKRPSTAGASQREKELTTKLETLANECAEKEGALDKLKRRVDNLLKENAKYKMEKEGNDSQFRNSMLAKLDAKNTQLTKENEELMHQLEAQRRLVAELQQEIHSLRQQFEKLSQQYQELQGESGGPGKREMFQEYVKLKRENEKLTSMLAKLQGALGGKGGANQVQNRRVSTNDPRNSRTGGLPRV